MPLYDCMLLLKPKVQKERLMDLVARVGKHVHLRNGVITEMKSFGTVQLGYGIKKLDGRYFQGQLIQMTMMATSNMNKELHYLNREDRLLRWLLVKHRNVKLGVDLPGDELRDGSIFDHAEEEDDQDDSDDEEDYSSEEQETETEEGGNQTRPIDTDDHDGYFQHE